MRKLLLFSLVFCLVFISRLPFLAPGYGTDVDAWRVASAAQRIAQTGEYTVSRFPGYPLQELLYSLVWEKDSFTFNSITAFFSAVAAGVFALILRRYGVHNPFFLAMGFAFIPVVFTNSVNSVDYLWALCFLLGSWYTLGLRQFLLAGVLAGCAIGCRITSILLLIPFGVFVRLESKDQPTIAPFRFILAAFLVGIFFYIPVVEKYGTSFLTFYPHGYPPAAAIFNGLTIETWGILGSTVLIIVVTSIIRSRFKRPPLEDIPALALPRSDRIAIQTTVGMIVFLFLAFPLDAGYLIPAIPFSLILIASALSEKRILWMSVSLALSSFVLSIDSIDRPWSPPPSDVSLLIEYQGRAIALDAAYGPVVKDVQRRRYRGLYVEHVLQIADTVEIPSPVASGVWFPQIKVTAGGMHSASGTKNFSVRRGCVEFVSFVDSTMLEKDIYGQRALSFLTSQDAYNLQVTGLDLRSVGGVEFPATQK